MADINKSIAINIDVVNKAKGDLSKIATDVKKVSTEMKSSTSVVQSATTSWKSLATGVFAGQAAFSAVQSGIRLMTGFLKESIQESANAAAQMAIVKQNVENAGFSYAKLGPQIEAYSQKMLQMGFDDESTAGSISKLLLVTHDYSQSLKLNQLAMDLARNKNISLEQATTSLAQVMQGAGAKALVQYGLSFKDGASAAEILNELQKKVQGSAEAFANTTAGKLATVKEQWSNIKQEVGDRLAPVLADLFTQFEEHLPEIEALVRGVVTVITKLASAVGFVVKAAEELGSVLGSGLTTEQQKANESMQDGVNQLHAMIGAYNAQHKEHIQYVDDISKLTQEQRKAIAHAYNLQEANKKTTESIKGVGIAGKGASDSLKNDFSLALQEQSGKIKAFDSSLTDLNKSLKDTQQSFIDFVSQKETSGANSMAKIIFDAQKALPELQKQLSDAMASDAGSGNSDQIERIKEDIKEKQSILESAKDDTFANNKELQAELAQLTKESTENELVAFNDRMMYEIQREKEKTDAKIALIQQEIAIQQKAKDDYLAANNLINTSVQQSAKIKALAIAQEEQQLKDLQKQVEAVANSYSTLSTRLASTNISLSTNATGKRAMGGPVSGGQPYVVGEKGPEMFVPNGSGKIIPSDKLGTGGLTININNPTVRNDNDIRMIISEVQRVLSRQQELAQYGSYK